MTHQRRGGANDHFIPKPEQKIIHDKYMDFSMEAIRKDRPKSDTWLVSFQKKMNKHSVALLLSYIPTMNEEKLMCAKWSLSQHGALHLLERYLP